MSQGWQIRSLREEFALLNLEDSVSENNAWQRKNQAGGSAEALLAAPAGT
jgi:hypothetical protein